MGPCHAEGAAHTSSDCPFFDVSAMWVADVSYSDDFEVHSTFINDAYGVGFGSELVQE